VFVASNCSGGGPGPAVNVDQSTRVTIDRVDAAGYVSGAIGIRLAGLAADAGVRVRRSFAGNNYDVGMLVDGAGARSLRVSKSILSYATVAGLIVQNANGIVVDRNRVRDNGTYGILVQSGSDGNQFAGNEIIGNGTDVTDNGSGNCWRSNTFVSGAVPPCP
jgi:parallel beta-helix repeat protein